MQEYTAEELERWIDRQAIDKEGHRLGIVADIYIDDATGKPEWLAVTTGLFGSRLSFAPLLGATLNGDKVQVAYEKSLIKDSPNMDADGQLTAEEEERLYRHYGFTYERNAADVRVIDATVAELQQTGSAALNADFTPEVALARMRKREEEEMKAIDLTTEQAEPSSHTGKS